MRGAAQGFRPGFAFVAELGEAMPSIVAGRQTIHVTLPVRGVVAGLRH
jgi:hypothetical protein